MKRFSGFLAVLLLLWQCGGLGFAQTAPASMRPAPQMAAPPSSSAMMAITQPQGGDYFQLQQKIYRWSDKTRFVMVYITEPTYLPDWQPWHTQLIKDAFTEWQHALANRLLFIFTRDTSQADVVVNWWPTSTAQVEQGACGINIAQTWGKYIAKNDIYMSFRNQNGYVWPPGHLYATALHEIGHMIGIKEHSDSPNDIMFHSTTSREHLSQRDINTALRIYATKADYANPVGYHLSQFEAFKKTQRHTYWIPIIIPIPI